MKSFAASEIPSNASSSNSHSPFSTAQYVSPSVSPRKGEIPDSLKIICLQKLAICKDRSTSAISSGMKFSLKLPATILSFLGYEKSFELLDFNFLEYKN